MLVMKLVVLVASKSAARKEGPLGPPHSDKEAMNSEAKTKSRVRSVVPKMGKVQGAGDRPRE